jgi:hypothetical protein
MQRRCVISSFCCGHAVLKRPCHCRTERRERESACENESLAHFITLLDHFMDRFDLVVPVVYPARESCSMFFEVYTRAEGKQDAPR